MGNSLIGEALASSIKDEVLLHAVAYETFYDVIIGGLGPKKQIVTSVDGIGLFLDYGNHVVPVPLVLFDKPLYNSEIDKLQERYMAIRKEVWRNVSIIVKSYAATAEDVIDEKEIEDARDRVYKLLKDTAIWQHLSIRTILLGFLFSGDKNSN